jgi:hypothetical protein
MARALSHRLNSGVTSQAAWAFCSWSDGQSRSSSHRGQAHELPQAVSLLDSLPGATTRGVLDSGHASHVISGAWEPNRCYEAPVTCPAWIYSNRNTVERVWARLKAVGQATRYERTA